MSSPWLLPGLFAVLLVLLCGLAYLVLAAVRTRHLDKCWHCGAEKIRHSKSHWSDKVAGLFFLRPYRCGRCLTRFYAFRTFAPAHPIAPIPITPVAPIVPAAVRKSPFRIRVKVIIRLPWPTDWKSAWELLLAEEAGFLAKPPDTRSRPKSF